MVGSVKDVLREAVSVVFNVIFFTQGHTGAKGDMVSGFGLVFIYILEQWF